ncbi:hypothetical protein EBS40_02810 [bacterium]|nr:hypothetical protein [bacterium]
MDFEIERLLFQQIDKPKNYLMTKIINVFHDYYRINVYTEIEEDGLIKRKISQSYLATFTNNVLNIIPENDKKPDDLKKKR